MQPYEIPGDAAGTALRFHQPGDGKLTMTVWSLDRLGLTGGSQSVVLQPGWVRPLAAWFAGEAEPAVLGDDALMPYPRRLAVCGDELAMVWATYTQAWLRCSEPYGTARIIVGPRGHMVSASQTVLLGPRARAGVAEFLRRADAESWAVR